MAFDYDEVNPTNDSYIADYPANERAHRTAVLGSVDVDHFAETNAFHRRVTLPPLGTDPTLQGTAGFVYTKEVSGLTELFYQDETAQVIQLTSDGSASPDKVAKAGDTMTGDLILDSSDIEIQTGELRLKAALAYVRDVADANWRAVLGRDASDVFELGSVSLVGGLRLRANTIDKAVVAYGSGDKKIWHAGHFANAPLITQIFESAEISFTDTGAGSQGVAAHGIGAIPKAWIGVLRCISGDLGYSANDEVAVMGGILDATARGFTLAANATNLIWRCAGNRVRLREAAGGGSAEIDVTKWRLVLRAWY